MKLRAHSVKLYKSILEAETGQAVGMVTSGSYGHRMHKAIGLAYFRRKVSSEDEPGIEILGRKSTVAITRPFQSAPF